MIFKDIKKENIPAWYEIGVRNKTDIVVRTHRKIVPVLEQKMVGRAPLIESLRKELKLPEFIGPTEKQWGFGQIIAREEDGPDWVSMKCSLPVIERKRDSQRVEDWGWDEAYVVSASLETLFRALDWMENEVETSYALPQLLTIAEFNTREGTNGGQLSVKIGKAMGPWLERQPDNSEGEKMVVAMMDVDSHMFPFRSSPRYRFSVRFHHSRNMVFKCPGNACGLYPEGSSDPNETGFMLYPHNTDNPHQQLMLLAGVAAMHELARKEGL